MILKCKQSGTKLGDGNRFIWYAVFEVKEATNRERGDFSVESYDELNYKTGALYDCALESKCKEI